VGTAKKEKGLDGLVAQLSRCKTAAARATFLRRHRDLWSPEVVERLYGDVVRLARTDLQQAERLARAAKWIADKLDDDGARAQSLRALGHVAFSLGKYSDALKRYDAALTLFRQHGRAVDVARTINGALQSLISLGRYEEAFASAEEARAIFDGHGNLLGLARLDTNVGNILYRQDRFDEALVLYERAHAQLARLGQPQDVAAALSNIAMVYRDLTDFERSLEISRQAREYCELHAMPLLVLQADYNIAYLYYLRGEYARALDLYRSAQEKCDAFGETYLSAMCDLDRSEIYLELNLSGEAADLGVRALAHFDKMKMEYEAAKAVTNVAIATSSQGELRRALKLFDQARELFAREQNQVWLAMVDFYEALVLYRSGDHVRARRACRTALRLFAHASAPGRAGLCELLLARLELKAGDLSLAERACDGAFETLAPAAMPNLMYQAHFVRGLIREAQGDRGSAYAAFQKARADLEHLRSHLQAEDLKVAFLQDKLEVYESLVETCLALGPDADNDNAAFGYIEEAKSRSLADLIAFRTATLAPRVPGKVSEDVHRLRHDLHWHYRQIELEEVRREKRSLRRMETLRLRATTLEKQLSRSLDELRRTDEEFATLQSGAAEGLDQIRSVLEPDTILLEYYQARGRYYVCVVGRDRLDVVPLGEAAEVRKRITLLQFQLSKFRLQPSYVSAFGDQLYAATEAHLGALYDALIAPISDRLNASHLVVVPHDILHGLPFHALFDGDRFLIDRFTISYAPSASVYRLCCDKPATTAGTSLIMGLPDALTPCLTEEVRAVSGLLPDPLVFVGDEATADELRAHGPSTRFVHIATHGLFRRDNPMFSSIRLGSGPLSVYDLYELRLSAELVTLSGCGTGLNVVVGGDELLGLVRGLLYAGARTVLLTLWDAYDRSTADFMQAFYGHLQRGSTKARAVQAATQEVRERYRHPFYWAPFTLVGHAS
jgi:CHAT domain-containing protein